MSTQNDHTVLFDVDGRRLSPNYKWVVVAMLWFITFFNYADRQALSANLKLIGDMFGLDDTWKGLLSSAFGYSYGMAAIFAGYVVDRVRRKNAVILGLCIWSVVCMLIASAQGFWMLFGFLALEGLGEAFYFPAAMSMVSDYHGKATRSRAMGINQTGVYIGTVGGTCIAALVATYSSWGWRAPFLLFGALGVVLGIVLWLFLYEPKRGAADLAESGAKATSSHRKIGWMEFFRLFFTTPTAVMLLLAFFFANSIATIVLSWMPTYVNETFFKSQTQGLVLSGLIATLPLQISSMIAAPLAGLSADRIRAKTYRGRILVQLIGALGAIPFVVICGQTKSATIAFAALAGWGVCKGIYDSNIFASVYDVIRPEARGMAAGIMNLLAWAAGGALAPPLFGAIAKHFDKVYGLGAGKPLTMTYASGLYVIVAILLTVAVVKFVPRDAKRMQEQLKAETEAD